jgi:hypothetical protein
MKAAGQDKKTDDFPVPQGVGWLDVNLKGDGYPLPVFESVPVARIPFVIGSKPLIQPLPSKEVKESPLPTSVGGEREESERPPDLAQPG